MEGKEKSAEEMKDEEGRMRRKGGSKVKAQLKVNLGAEGGTEQGEEPEELLRSEPKGGTGAGNSHSRCAPQLRRGRTRLVAPGANADSGTRHKDRRTEREPGRRTKKDSGCGYDVKTRRLLREGKE